jgi:hypothetical protein
VTDTAARPAPSVPRSTQEELAAETARAPTVHNVQPARWRFTDDGCVILFRAHDRTLPVADPSGHDIEASLGAAYEGLAIALSRRGITLGGPTPETRAVAAGCSPVLRAELMAGAVPDPLASFVFKRRSWRGRFAAHAAADRERLAALTAPDTHFVAEPSQIAQIAGAHDLATWKLERRDDYHRELWQWLRLSPRHPRYHRDGLNAECLTLSPAERRAAQLLLRPPVFRLLGRVGVARHLVSEASQVRSALTLLLFCPRRSESAFHVGRRMYRLWLEITAAGLHMAPMSACADDATTRQAIERRYAIPSDRRLANVFRVGRAPVDVPVSPRLPVSELLV